MAGTQAERSHTNNLIVMKMGNLHRTKREIKDKEEDDSDDESDDEEDEDKKPELETAMIKHTGCVNRVRVSIFTILIS